MKTRTLIVLVIAANVIGLVVSLAQPTTLGTAPITADLNSYRSLVTSQTYNRVMVASWLTVEGKKNPGAMSVTLSDSVLFDPKETSIVCQHEPVVSKREDGVWVITFKPKEP